MVRETGNGKTPERVVFELNKKLKETSLNAISKATGVGISALHRYQKGIGEPTTATLKKLADCFGTSVAWLRGEDNFTNKPIWMTKDESNEFLKELPEVANGEGVILIPFYGNISPLTLGVIVPTISQISQYFDTSPQNRDSQKTLDEIEKLWKEKLQPTTEFQISKTPKS